MFKLKSPWQGSRQNQAFKRCHFHFNVSCLSFGTLFFFFFFSFRPKKCYRPHLLFAFILHHTLNSQAKLYSLLFLKAFLPQCLFSHYFLYLDINTCSEFNSRSCQKKFLHETLLFLPHCYIVPYILYLNLIALS